MEDARRASFADEEARQMRAVELVIGASSSTNVEMPGGIADSVGYDVDINERVHITEVVGSGEPDPQLADRRRFAPQICFTYHSCIQFLLCIGENCMSFFWGCGKWKVSASVKSE